MKELASLTMVVMKIGEKNTFSFIYHRLLKGKSHSVHPPPPPSATSFSKRRALTGPQLLQGVAGKEGVTFFRGGCNFHQKKKLKSEIFNEKKSLLAKIFFSVIDKMDKIRLLYHR